MQMPIFQVFKPHLGNLVDQWTQVTHICPLRHVCTSCGGICRGPLGDADVAQDAHDAEAGNFDDDAYVSQGGGSDDINVSFVDILCGEGDSQEQHVKI